jgi:hypothetical protein
VVRTPGKRRQGSSYGTGQGSIELTTRCRVTRVITDRFSKQPGRVGLSISEFSIRLSRAAVPKTSAGALGEKMIWPQIQETI